MTQEAMKSPATLILFSFRFYLRRALQKRFQDKEADVAIGRHDVNVRHCSRSEGAPRRYVTEAS